MNVLILKTSSIGDILHTLPALTDAAEHIPDITFDWVAEESCAEIPLWHAKVERVIPVAIRRWRKTFWKHFFSGEYIRFLKMLRAKKYDLIIDAQGLTKSALIGRLAKGPCYGLDSKSARDPVAFIHYKRRYSISWEQHAVSRIRELFANALGYSVSSSLPNYGLRPEGIAPTPFNAKYLVFLHGTTWTTKLYPETYWRELVKKACEQGYAVYLNSGNPAELARAQRITENIERATAMPRKNFATLASILQGADGVVAVDTGLGHLTAALGRPAVSVYGSTNAKLTGAFGFNQTHIQSSYACSPCMKKTCGKPPIDSIYPACFAEVKPEIVWEKLCKQMQRFENPICV